MSFDYRKNFIGNQINWSVRTGKNKNVYSKELFGGNIEANSVSDFFASFYLVSCHLLYTSD